METTKKTVREVAEQTDLLILRGDSRYNGGVWSDIPLSDSASLPYGNLDRHMIAHESDSETRALVYAPSLLSGSDYSGCSVTISNFRAFKEQFKALQSTEWWELWGGHGTYAIAIRATCDNEEILEFFESISDYPVADEDLMAEVENEAENESWESWIRSDFTRELKKHFNEDTIDELTDAELRELLACGMERANEYFEHETGGGVFVRLEKVVAALTLEDVENGGDK